MFSSGVVKLTSNCPLWWSLRALDVHFESQCLPTPLAWYAHAFPANWLHLATALTLVLEIILPFAFFLPIRSLQWMSFYTQVAFQLMIIATGNYNFFNLLTIVLCFSLLDDHLCGCWKGNKTSSGDQCSWLSNLVTGIGLAVVGYYTVHYFNVGWAPGDSFWAGPSTKVAFSYEDFNYFLPKAITVAMWMGSISFVLVALYALYKAATVGSLSGRVLHVATTATWIVVIGFLAVISMVPLANLDTTGAYLRTMPPTAKRWYFASQHLNIVSEYGLFRSMTGDGGRPELIIEGSNDLNAEDQWQPYHFLYKPGDLYRPPSVIGKSLYVYNIIPLTYSLARSSPPASTRLADVVRGPGQLPAESVVVESVLPTVDRRADRAQPARPSPHLVLHSTKVSAYISLPLQVYL